MAFVVDCKSQNCGYWNRDVLTTSYFDDIKKYPMLSSIEERKLLEKVKSGNPTVAEEARRRLVECNQRFVVSVARRWQNINGDNLLDIVNEGNIGLMKAIDNYNLSSKNRLITYAVYWIRKSIEEYIVSKSKMVTPPNANKLNTFVPKVYRDFFAENERYPTIQEAVGILKKKYNVNVKHPIDLERVSVFSVDGDFTNSEESRYNSNINEYESATSSNNIEDYLKLNDIRETIKVALMALDENEKYIITNYYGIDCEEMSIEAIGKYLGMTKERVRQIMNSSLKKMRLKSKIIKKV